MILQQPNPVTLAARYIEPAMTTLASKERAPQRQILRPQLERHFLYSTGMPRILHVCDKTLTLAQVSAWAKSNAKSMRLRHQQSTRTFSGSYKLLDNISKKFDQTPQRRRRLSFVEEFSLIL
jgi:hypothetical protein